jgi:hypothetical protein
MDTSNAPGANDMAQLRAQGIQSYGVGAARTGGDYGTHSDVERMQESSCYQFIEFTWNVTDVTVSK